MTLLQFMTLIFILNKMKQNEDIINTVTISFQNWGLDK